jgi:dTDP-4-amino-4,6-dideoxygalactose transaminase
MNNLDLRAVVLPKAIIEKFLSIEKEVLESGNLAWSVYDKNWWNDGGIFRIPVSSNCTGQLLVAMYHIAKHGIKALVYPKNTFEGIKTTYRMLHAFGIQTYQVDMGLNNTNIPSAEDIRELTGHFIDDVLLVATNIGGMKFDYDTSDYLHVMLDGAHAQFLEYEEDENYDSVVYSFFATKSTPVGEGGLIATRDEEMADWLIQTLMYDKPHFKALGLNFRVSTATALKMRYLLTSGESTSTLLEHRVDIWQMYAKVCTELGVSFVNPRSGTMNGYKFMITDPRITDMECLTTSKAFELYHNVCPATYPQLSEQLPELERVFRSIITKNLEKASA